MQIAVLVEPRIYGIEMAAAVKARLGIDVGQPQTTRTYLNALASIAGKQFDVSNPGTLLRQLSYTIVVNDTDRTLLAIKTSTTLSVVESVAVDGEGMLILAGSLLDFRTEIINGCSLSSNKLFREFTTALLCLFDSKGLGFVFEAYRRKINPSADGPQILLESR